MIVVTLPWPPTNNHLTIAAHGRRIASPQAREYKKLCNWTINKPRKPITGRLKVLFEMYPPDRRKRDLDNFIKAPQDAITDSGIWGDDSVIDDLRAVRMPVRTGGMVVAYIEEIEEVAA